MLASSAVGKYGDVCDGGGAMKSMAILRTHKGRGAVSCEAGSAVGVLQEEGKAPELHALDRATQWLAYPTL